MPEVPKARPGEEPTYQQVILLANPDQPDSLRRQQADAVGHGLARLPGVEFDAEVDGYEVVFHGPLNDHDVECLRNISDRSKMPMTVGDRTEAPGEAD